MQKNIDRFTPLFSTRYIFLFGQILCQKLKISFVSTKVLCNALLIIEKIKIGNDNNKKCNERSLY